MCTRASVVTACVRPCALAQDADPGAGAHCQTASGQRGGATRQGGSADGEAVCAGFCRRNCTCCRVRRRISCCHLRRGSPAGRGTARGMTLPMEPAALPASLVKVAQAARTAQPGQRLVHALYCGGTLAHEALGLLRRPWAPWSRTWMTPWGQHLRPPMWCWIWEQRSLPRAGHPMIDPSTRRPYLIEAADNPAVAVVLADVMLGWGSACRPGRSWPVLARGAGSGRRGGASAGGDRPCLWCPDDPQGFAQQCQILREHGLLLADSNARYPSCQRCPWSTRPR